jgi:hypothetical protein
MAYVWNKTCRYQTKITHFAICIHFIVLNSATGKKFKVVTHNDRIEVIHAVCPWTIIISYESVIHAQEYEYNKIKRCEQHPKWPQTTTDHYTLSKQAHIVESGQMV